MRSIKRFDVVVVVAVCTKFESTCIQFRSFHQIRRRLLILYTSSTFIF